MHVEGFTGALCVSGKGLEARALNAWGDDGSGDGSAGHPIHNQLTLYIYLF